MLSVNVQRQRWCEQDHATVSVESSTSLDRQQRWPDVRRNSVDMTAQPADDWQQNADVALMQSQRLERSEQLVLRSSTVQTSSPHDYAEFVVDTLTYVEPMINMQVVINNSNNNTPTYTLVSQLHLVRLIKHRLINLLRS